MLHSHLPADQHRKLSMAYFLTYHTYGTWLHGSNEGSVDRRHRQHESPTLGADPNWVAESRHRMNQGPAKLNERQRGITNRVIRDVCNFRGWTLHELNVRTNHVHVVVNADALPEKVMHDFKAYATRRMREANAVAAGKRVWSRHGSTRYLWDEHSVARACEYVREGQGADLPMEPGDPGALGTPRLHSRLL